MNTIILSFLIKLVPKLHKFHDPKNLIFKTLRVLIKFFANNYKKYNSKEINFFPYNINGNLKWPLKQFGNLDSYCYFELQEILLHIYYYLNRQNYKFTNNFGTNIGIDAVVLSSLNIETYGYEPDKDLLKFASKAKKLNKLKNLKLFPFGILDKNQTKVFIKVLNNLNASHVKGARGFYGKHKEIKCKFKNYKSMNIKKLPDLMKINIEGSEGNVVASIPKKIWSVSDVFIEVHDKSNRKILWNFFNKNKLNIFSQKIGWEISKKLEDLPISNKEGYIFVSSKKTMNWNY